MLSFMPRSVPTISVPMGSNVPAVPLSVPLGCPTPSSSLTSSGQSATPSSQTLARGDAGDSSVPLSPNRVQAGRSLDVPEEGSLPCIAGFAGISDPAITGCCTVSSGGGAVAVDDGWF